MFRVVSRACLVAVLVLTIADVAAAHGVVGDRMFIEPIAAEDANVKNELVLPNSEFLRSPDGTLRTMGVSLEKSVYRDRVSVIVESGRIVRTGGEGSGWDNLELGVKWEAYK